MELLPNEILHIILAKLDRRSWKNLCEVSKDLREIATPYLYESFILRTGELDLPGLVSVLENTSVSCMQHTRHISIEAPFHTRLRRRCPHHEDPRVADVAVMRRIDELLPDSDDEDDLDVLSNLKSAFDTLARGIPSDKLQSFRGDASALNTQTKLKTISLTTDGTCGSNIETQFFVDLVPFQELQALSWRGLGTFGDFEAVKKCIAAHGDSLTSLTLDLISWERAAHTWRKTLTWQSPMPTTTHQNFFASNVLGVQVGQAIERLPSLDRLSLSAVSFRTVPLEMACALNFAGLRELELWHCPYSLRLLGALVEFAPSSMTLKSFKFTIDSDPGSPPASCDAIVARFLKSFQGLERLHLMLPVPIDWGVLCGGVMKHSSTLQHVVAHTRTEAYLSTRNEAPLSDDDFDRNIPWSDDIARLLRGPRLVGIGLSIPPSVLMEKWKTGSSKPTSCEALHIRASGRPRAKAAGPSGSRDDGAELLHSPGLQGFVQLADWAFGADGLPALQILAWGDFSFDRRFAADQLVLCRHENSYRPLPRADALVQGVAADYAELLLACPAERLMD